MCQFSPHFIGRDRGAHTVGTICLLPPSPSQVYETTKTTSPPIMILFSFARFSLFEPQPNWNLPPPPLPHPVEYLTYFTVDTTLISTYTFLLLPYIVNGILISPKPK